MNKEERKTLRILGYTMLSLTFLALSIGAAFMLTSSNTILKDAFPIFGVTMMFPLIVGIFFLIWATL